MNIGTKTRVKIAAAVAVSLALLLLAQGCKKEQPAAQQTETNQMSSTADEMATTAKDTAETTTTEVVAAAEQTTCPVMEGNPINKDLFVEYKGKKVYFCCRGCEEKFLADPEKYVAKLPQFKQ